MEATKSKIGRLKEVIALYTYFTGVSVQKTGDNSFKVVFQELNPADLEQQCTVDVTVFNDTFLVSDMSPRVKDYYDFVQYLSIYRDLKTFLKIARKSFVSHFSAN